MISLDLLRKYPEKYKAAAKNKNRLVDVDRILVLDEKASELQKKAQVLREKRNNLAKLGKKDPNTAREEGKKIKVELKILEEEYSKLVKERDELIAFVPNEPLPEVPVGKDESDNKEVKKVGDLPKFDFEPLDHMELGKRLDIVDTERGSKISGFRGYYLKNQGAVLHMSVLLYVLQKLTAKGYNPIIAPAIVKKFTLFGSGHLPWGEKELYKLNGDEDDAYLSATAEIPVTAYFSGEVLNESDLPKKFVAFSPCYRSEAGSYGKDTKGLYRLHEFFKIEQVILAKNDDDEARKLHEELQANCEDILKDLELPYRVLLMCTGDMGEPQMKKYDTETWMPSRKAYGETMSNSIMGDFQTRRLNIKYKTKDGKIEYCYSLNNTALASPRILIALLENHQQKDGSILIPEKLRSVCGFEKIIKK